MVRAGWLGTSGSRRSPRMFASSTTACTRLNTASALFLRSFCVFRLSVSIFGPGSARCSSPCPVLFIATSCCSGSCGGVGHSLDTGELGDELRSRICLYLYFNRVRQSHTGTNQGQLVLIATEPQ